MANGQADFKTGLFDRIKKGNWVSQCTYSVIPQAERQKDVAVMIECGS
jgi:hypothetical protein